MFSIDSMCKTNLPSIRNLIQSTYNIHFYNAISFFFCGVEAKLSSFYRNMARCEKQKNQAPKESVMNLIII